MKYPARCSVNPSTTSGLTPSDTKTALDIGSQGVDARGRAGTEIADLVGAASQPLDCKERPAAACNGGDRAGNAIAQRLRAERDVNVGMIETRAAEQAVIARFADQDVVAGVAVERIVAAASEDVVVAIEAVDGLAAVIADDVVVVVGARDDDVVHGDHESLAE